MVRYRRYRVFVLFAVIAVVALYRFGSSSTPWTPHSSSSEKSASEGNDARLNWQPRPQVAKETKPFTVDVPAARASKPLQTPPPVVPVSRPAKKLPTPTASSTKPATKPTSIGAAYLGDNGPAGDDLEDTAAAASDPTVHWQKQSEYFPVPSKSLIRLPSGAPKSLPKIQFKFKKESASQKADREAKLHTIKDVFKRSWEGYRDRAWLQDELSPVSGRFRNPFAGWGATLVDSLDALWIMGFKEYFEEAVKAVDEIDFTTTTARNDIPMFETTIRYLGGLIAAYDLSGKKYKSLLDKAEELGEILISAFDTPNRMPNTYYHWKPNMASKGHRVSNRVVLAEIGSLSMEFTRLAQLTGEHKYYDAIARITDNFEEFQNQTRLPGMWPTYLDASGCKPVSSPLDVATPLQAPFEPSEDVPLKNKAEVPTTNSPTDLLSPGGNKYIPLDLPSPVVFKPDGPNPTWQPAMGGSAVLGGPGKGTHMGRGKSSALKRRQLGLDRSEALQDDVYVSQIVATSALAPSHTAKAGPTCEEQGFGETSSYGPEDYTLGGMSDSTYEYLPKEFLLLGGQVDKYRTMYELSMDVVKEHLVFRPMLPNEDDILFSGKLTIPGANAKSKNGVLEGENAHLSCFAGGMLAMGAKLFDRPEDLEVAKKLTEGCVWAYQMTSTGIMPEAFDVFPCASTVDCAWNETKYYQILDPNASDRIDAYKQQMEVYKQQVASMSASYEAALAAMTPVDTHTAIGGFAALPTPTVLAHTLDKRQLADLEDDTPDPEDDTPDPEASPFVADDRNSVMGGESEEGEGPPAQSKTVSAAIPQVSEDRDSVMGGESEEGEGPPSPLKKQSSSTVNHVSTSKTISAATPLVSEDRESVMGGESEEGEGPPLAQKKLNTAPVHHSTEDRESVMGGESEEGEGPPTKVQPTGANIAFSPVLPNYSSIYSPKPPLSHSEYVKNKIQEERLPLGVTQIQARSYILRPEAIESVWYMYRITGDAHWREAGWRMFEAVNAHTTAKYGNSAIDDVTKTKPELQDEMESFWLAETLKYFYLLFTEEDVVSLDDWVLNTEAHPFRRPK